MMFPKWAVMLFAKIEQSDRYWVVNNNSSVSFVLTKFSLTFLPSSLCLSLSLLSQDENGVVLSLGAESQRVIVSARPFRLDIMEGRDVLMSLNSRGLLAFEHLRMRKDTWETTHAHTFTNASRLFLIHVLTQWMISVFVPMKWFVFWVLSLTRCSVLFSLSS